MLLAMGLQLHFANQAKHRTGGPLLLKKGTATVVFRESGEKGGIIAAMVILYPWEAEVFRPDAGYRWR
jgi:hypothetical protein